MGKNKIEKVDSQLAEWGWERLSEYVTAKHKMLVRSVRCGHQYERSFQNIRKRNECVECYYESIRLTEKQADEQLPPGYVRLSPFLGRMKPMRVRCGNGHEYTTTLVGLQK
jgi:hypothetical protein